jgi:hypothetical protein
MSNSNPHPLSQLDPSKRILKRAQYEAFAFSLLGGDVLVRNESHANPENHEYRVTIENGLPMSCECPADEHTEEACKHRVGVAIRPSIIESANEMQALTDGGIEANHSPGDSLEDEAPHPGCAHLSKEIPCWECVRSGRREIPGGIRAYICAQNIYVFHRATKS